MSWKSRFPRTPIDDAIARQREIVLRLPKWLVGTSVITAFALGLTWAVREAWLMRQFERLYDDEFLAGMATVAFTVLPVMLALYGLARVLRPRPPSNLPEARLRE